MKAKCKECGHKFEFDKKEIKETGDNVNGREIVRWYICCPKCLAEINLAEARR